MGFLFSGCSSLISLPDISKWNLINVRNIKGMFSECSSLIMLPDISNWFNFNRDIDFTPQVKEEYKVKEKFLLFSGGKNLGKNHIYFIIVHN